MHVLIAWGHPQSGPASSEKDKRFLGRTVLNGVRHVCNERDTNAGWGDGRTSPAGPRLHQLSRSASQWGPCPSGGSGKAKDSVEELGEDSRWIVFRGGRGFSVCIVRLAAELLE